LVKSLIDNLSIEADKKIGFLQIWFYRPLSIFISNQLIKSFNFINPNHLTLIGLLIGTISFIIMVIAKESSILLFSVILWNISKLFDFIDGNLARYYKKKTYLGKFLDGYFDLLNSIFLIIGIGMYLGNFYIMLAFITSLMMSLSNMITFRLYSFLDQIKKNKNKLYKKKIKNNKIKINISFLVKRIIQYIDYCISNLSMPSLILAIIIDHLNLWFIIYSFCILVSSILIIIARIYTSFKSLNVLR
jgi:phosphatidylglycerophosphate synthase